MSLREIGIALRQIDVRTYNEFAMQANCWGAKVKIRDAYADSVEVKPTAKPEALERQKNEFFERKRRALNG